MLDVTPRSRTQCYTTLVRIAVQERITHRNLSTTISHNRAEAMILVRSRQVKSSACLHMIDTPSHLAVFLDPFLIVDYFPLITRASTPIAPSLQLTSNPETSHHLPQCISSGHTAPLSVALSPSPRSTQPTEPWIPDTKQKQIRHHFHQPRRSCLRTLGSQRLWIQSRGRRQVVCSMANACGRGRTEACFMGTSMDTSVSSRL